MALLAVLHFQNAAGFRSAGSSVRRRPSPIRAAGIVKLTDCRLFTGHLRADEMGHELDDFCRRGVFKEEKGQYWPTVELFGRWFRDGGFARLVDGHLGDELEEKRRLWNRIPDNVHLPLRRSGAMLVFSPLRRRGR